MIDVYSVPTERTSPRFARALAETDLTRIETPRYPRDRRRWAAVLADNQWTFAEMAEGAAWRKLNEVL